ncbi:hypothetical protein M2322_004642 [Rhodoblastus acidophilus]|uniref:copper-binding protein n=1 Tax=Rhodoblastus acidophilus TaxID=1074 RepID=UPI002225784A|nr:copper-binding protein [Rhodoblastus acidophilus]MCW2319073.1 hypothetical protein [Rhodoblastus acidophilus]
MIVSYRFAGALALAAGCAYAVAPLIPHVQLISSAQASDDAVLFYRDPMGGPDVSKTPKKDSMGMDFGVGAGVDLAALKAGSKIAFTLTRGADGMYAIESVQPSR